MKPLKDMTAEELVEYHRAHVPYGKFPTIELLDSLADKLKEAITPNPDEIHIVWSVEDVYAIAEQDGVQITLDEAREVLRRIEAGHYALDDVTRDYVYNTTLDVLEGR